MRLEIVHAWLCMRPPASEEFAREIGRSILHDVTVLGPPGELGAALGQQERPIFKEFGAPLGGLLMNEL